MAKLRAMRASLRALVVLGCLIRTAVAGAAIEPASWKSWSPREEIAPAFSVDATSGRSGGAALKIAARDVASFGAWRSSLGDVQPGQTYRFVAWFRAARVDDERRSVIARLQWLDAAGKPVRITIRPPEYPIDGVRENGWVQMEKIVQAPEGARALDVQLSLGFSKQGAVWWDDVRLTAIEPPRERIVRAMTVDQRPRGLKSAAANVEHYRRLVRAAAAQRPDIICFPEGMTVVGTGKTYVDVSEPVPGPTTESLGELARELRSYVVGGLYERVGHIVYNTAVLIDRQGKLAGTYRKTHLPREEWEAGLTPGDSYPIFETDFGRLGLMICWDVQFPEPWRALGLQGAELVLIPIWGGSETLLQARAIENHAFVVSAGYNIKSCVVAPDGKILAEANQDAPVVTTALNLDAKIYQPWLGDMRTRTWKERRGDLPRGGP